MELRNKMERIPFEIFEQADNERLELERLRELSNTELVEFADEAMEHIEDVYTEVSLAMKVLEERGFVIDFGDSDE
jgi:hypothetical protein